MSSRRGSSALVLIIVFALLVGGLGIWYQPKPVSPAENLEISLDKAVNKLSPELTVRVYDSMGNLKTVIVKEDDLVLNNFKLWLSAWLGTTTASATASTNTLKDTSNQDRVVTGKKWSTSYIYTWCDSASGTGNKGGIMALGTGTTAPTVSDYGCETIYGAFVNLDTTAPVYNSTTGEIVVVNTFSITDTVSISEVVLGYNWVGPSTTAYSFALFRDTFSPISVENGDTVAIAYVIDLDDTGFTNNFGVILAEVFRSVADGTTSTSKTIVDKTGTNKALECYDDDTEYVPALTIRTANPVSSWINVGTSSTATSRSHYALVSEVEDISGGVVTHVISGDVWVQGNVYCAEARTITEAGYFCYIGDGNPSPFMLFRDTFAGVSVDAEEWVNAKFVIGM